MIVLSSVWLWGGCLVGFLSGTYIRPSGGPWTTSDPPQQDPLMPTTAGGLLHGTTSKVKNPKGNIKISDAVTERI